MTGLLASLACVVLRAQARVRPYLYAPRRSRSRQHPGDHSALRTKSQDSPRLADFQATLALALAWARRARE